MSNYKHLIQENAWLRQKLAELQETPSIDALMSYLDKADRSIIGLTRKQGEWNERRAKRVIPSADYGHKIEKRLKGRKRAVVSIADQYATQHTEDALKRLQSP